MARGISRELLDSSSLDNTTEVVSRARIMLAKPQRLAAPSAKMTRNCPAQSPSMAFNARSGKILGESSNGRVRRQSKFDIARAASCLRYEC